MLSLSVSVCVRGCVSGCMRLFVSVCLCGCVCVCVGGGNGAVKLHENKVAETKEMISMQVPVQSTLPRLL